MNSSTILIFFLLLISVFSNDDIDLICLSGFFPFGLVVT